MASENYMNLINSEFSDDEEKKVNYASVVGFALDNIKRKEILEGVYQCYVPFYAIRVSDGNYIVVNALNTDKSKLSVSKVPTMNDLKPVLESEHTSLDSLYRSIENALLSKSVHNVEISGALVKKSVEGMAKLITHHGSTRDSRFKKLNPLVNKDDVKREVVSISKYAITDHELETELNLLFDEIVKSLSSKIEIAKRDKARTIEEYDRKISETTRVTENRIKQIQQDEQTEKRKIDEDADEERQAQVTSVKGSKRWNQLKKDVAMMQDSYSELISSIDQVRSGDQFDMLLSKIRAVQDETQSFGVGLNTALSEIEYRKEEYEDIFHQAEVDKRNISDRMAIAKEDARREVIDVENEKTAEVQEKESDILLATDILSRFNNNRANLLKKIKSNYIMFSAYSLSGDLLGVAPNEQLISLYVPVAIGKFKDKSKLSYVVIPPFEISDRMKKPRLLTLNSLYGRIGFDCVAYEALSFLKKPLENLLSNNQNLQAEIKGDNNEVIKGGDLSMLNAGLTILEQRKKLPKKYADEILGRSRSLLS